MASWTDLITQIESILLLAGGVAGYFTLRSSLAKSQSEISEKLRADLTAENTLLSSQVARLEKEVRRLSRVVQTIAALLKKALGIELQVNGSSITLRSKDGTLTTQYLNLEEEKELS